MRETFLVVGKDVGLLSFAEAAVGCSRSGRPRQECCQRDTQVERLSTSTGRVCKKDLLKQETVSEGTTQNLNRDGRGRVPHDSLLAAVAPLGAVGALLLQDVLAKDT